MVKDLLSRMLKEKEEERINWYEIFDHEIVRF